jgi:hypothetical protein
MILSAPLVEMRVYIEKDSSTYFIGGVCVHRQPESQYKKRILYQSLCLTKWDQDVIGKIRRF